MMHVLVLSVVVLADGALSERSGLSTAAGMQEQALEHEWDSELQPTAQPKKYQSPIQRVVRLLTEMKEQLEKEAEKDEELYDKMVCWCETTEKEKTKAIADADAKDLDLTAEIEERSARHGVLSTEMEQTKKEIEEETEALEEATGIREKEAGEFRGSEKDMVQAITNLKNAIMVLSRNHGGSLLQVNSKVLSSLHAVLEDVSVKAEVLLGDRKQTGGKIHAALISLGTDQGSSALRGLRGALDAYRGDAEVLPAKYAARVLARFAEGETGSSFLQQPAGAGESYAPQSGVIFGILKQLKDEFESSLATSQKDEKNGSEDYSALSESKEAQIAAARKQLDALLQEKATNEKGLYDAKEDLELTRTQRSADVKFLSSLKLTCNDLDKQWEERSKMRSEEITAVSEAIAIIMEDDSREQVSKTVTLLQVSVSTRMAQRALRTRVANTLRRAAQQPDFDDLLDSWRGLHNPDTSGPRVELSTLAVSVELDAFTKVKEAMDAMVQELKAQSAEDVKTKQFCTTEFNENEKQTYVKTEEKDDLEGQMEQLDAALKRLTEEVEAAKADISNTQVEVKKASETREGENAEFQTTVADQRATQVILKKALARLEVFYKKKSLLQQGQEPVPPVHFQPMKKSSGASPVMGLIEQIIEESKAVEQESVAGEASAQADYEKFVKNSNALIASLTQAVTEKTKGKADAQAEREQAVADHRTALGELENLNAYKADLHSQCDFIVKNFDIRQKARLQEQEAIQEAKGILSGAMSN